MVTYMVTKLTNQVGDEGWCRDPNFKLVFGAVCVEIHPDKNLAEEEGCHPSQIQEN